LKRVQAGPWLPRSAGCRAKEKTVKEYSKHGRKWTHKTVFGSSAEVCGRIGQGS
jgi:hypothetical protein